MSDNSTADLTTKADDITIDLTAIEAEETSRGESSRYQKRSGHLPHGPEGLPAAHLRSELPSPENIDRSALSRGLRRIFGRS